jgi:hypothetical protein
MFIILSWFGIIFNLIEFVLRGILMNTMHSDIYCTNSSTISCPSIVFLVTPLRRSAPAYILALRDLFLTVRERMSISCLNSLLPSVSEVTCAIFRYEQDLENPRPT